MSVSQVSSSALYAWFQATGAGERFGYDSPTVSLGEYVETAERIAHEQNEPCLGWTIGSHLPLTCLGERYTAITQAKTLRTVLKRMGEFFELLQDSSDLRLEENETDCSLNYRILDPTIWPRHQDAIFTLAIKLRILRSCNAVPLDQIEIILETEDYKAAHALQQLTGVQCTAGGEVNAIRFPRALLDCEIVGGKGVEQNKIRELHSTLNAKRRSEPLEERVRCLVYQDLGSRPINQNTIACELGLSPRTLRRQLAAQGVSFQELLDQCRMQQARHEMRRGRASPITQLALRLGYSEHSTFSRAFARWNGEPPLAYLRSHSGQYMAQ